MATALEAHLHLEVGHILFLDIVGYSKLSINHQHAAVEELNQIVRATGEFQKADASQQLIKIATGDGMALVFYTSPEAPAQCAVEISRALKEHPRLQLRMGIHSGPVSGVVDVNERANLAGAGINVAQRIMECGDAGHILLSKHVAEDLAEFEEWRPLLHDLGTCEVKHGVRVSVVNLYADHLGNPQLPKKFHALKKHGARMRWAALLGLAALVAGIAIFSRYRIGSTASAPAKSVAVLPFENLSAHPENAFFTDGVQDEILTNLAKIAELKVISRSSVMQYKSGVARNLQKIGAQLGVAHLVEGSVQRAGNRVRVNAQLIDARSGSHLWANTYDQDLADVFAIQSDIAKSIVVALQAKLTGEQKSNLERKPTSNVEAYDAYLRGMAYSLHPGYSPSDNLEAIRHFREAARLDPKFAKAWAWLAYQSALGYFNHIAQDRSALRQEAKDAANMAIELEPDLGEAYLAQGYSCYYGDEDYDSAIAWFEKANQIAPNNSEIPYALAKVYRRKGDWQRSVTYFREAVELNPRDISLLYLQAWALVERREYSAALKACNEILDIIPDNEKALSTKIQIYQAQGDLAASAALLPPLPQNTQRELFVAQIDQWTYERRYRDAITALKAALDNPQRTQPTWYYEAALASSQQLSGDAAAAKLAWQQVRTEVENLRQNDPPGPPRAVVVLALAYAALGDKAEAFATAGLLAASKDADRASYFTETMADIAVQAGDKNLALEQLAASAQHPAGVTYGDLKLNPRWDPLRGDPRFEKIVQSLGSKQ
jgi:TolB-like protein/Flp pilus assembly protein TadD